MLDVVDHTRSAPTARQHHARKNTTSIVFAIEPWFAVCAEIWPLWRAHFDEIGEDKGRIPLKPDFIRYEHLDHIGSLRILTARRKGKLVGYVFSIVDMHLHYRDTRFAAFDLYYLSPEARGGRTAFRMFEAAERDLAAQGVVKVVGQTKVRHDHGRLFEALGWREAERVFVKVL